MSTTILSVFSCDTSFDGEVYLRADYNISCNSKLHAHLRTVAFIAMAIYPIGIPAFYFTILLRDRSLINPVSAAESTELLSKDTEHTNPVHGSEVEMISVVTREPASDTGDAEETQPRTQKPSQTETVASSPTALVTHGEAEPASSADDAGVLDPTVLTKEDDGKQASLSSTEDDDTKPAGPVDAPEPQPTDANDHTDDNEPNLETTRDDTQGVDPVCLENVAENTAELIIATKAGDRTVLVSSSNSSSSFPAYRKMALQDRALQLRNEDTRIQHVRFLFEAYRPSVWYCCCCHPSLSVHASYADPLPPDTRYFEVVECARRLLSTAFLVVCRDGTATQIVASVAVTMTAICVYVELGPYVEESDNRLAFLASVSLAGTQFAALLMFTNVSR